MSDSPGRFPRHPLTHNGLHSPHRGSRSWPAARGHRLSARWIGADLRRHSESFTKLPSLPGMLPPAPTFPLVPALIIEADSARLPRASWKLPFAWQGARTSPPCRGIATAAPPPANRWMKLPWLALLPDPPCMPPSCLRIAVSAAHARKGGNSPAPLHRIATFPGSSFPLAERPLAPRAPFRLPFVPVSLRRTGLPKISSSPHGVPCPAARAHGDRCGSLRHPAAWRQSRRRQRTRRGARRHSCGSRPPCGRLYSFARRCYPVVDPA